ncbi:phage tail protein [Serratia sp. CY52157]|uniref:phage tail protein n=1 Tax=Serratia TaxID=613 RepID=UPI00092A29FD|nr:MULTISPECIES: phage tail protein [Serratia]AWC81266.1 phage tail protein [Serratia marcescens]MBJ2105116.1 phage tail protein [Serratia ureilytica]OJH84359.1 phage minor tail protein [Serratia marcescens]
MGIQTFEFPARVNAAGDMRFRVRKAQFGDGYAQVSGDGINPIVRSWELTFVGKYDYITPIIVFLENHHGVKSFQWTPPTQVPGLYRCEGYKPVAMGGDNYSLTATFTEAFHV